MNKRQRNIICRILFAVLLLVNGAAMAQRSEQQHVSVGGNIFGGGKSADVKGSSIVLIDQDGAIIGTLNGETQTLVENTGDVYGGGEKAKVNVTATTTNNVTSYSHTSGTSTNVTLRVGTVRGNLYGGGLGVRPTSDEDPGTPADVFGPVQVTINGGTVNGSVFGCNNLFGAPQTNVVVDVLKDPNNVTMSLQNVYGGGNFAAYSNNGNNYPEVNIKHGTVGGSVFGGGLGESAEVTANPQVTIGDEVENHTAVVNGKVYGGGDEAAVNGSTTVTVQNANSQVGVDVYGGGNQADVSGSTTVHINNGTIGQDVYGGGAFANVGTDGNDNTIVNVLGGTVTRDVYGGGLGRKEEGQPGETGYVAPIAAAVNGVVTVNIGALTGALENGFAPSSSVTGSATIGGSVFGCNNSNGTPKDNVTVHIYKTARTTGVNTVDDQGFAIAQVFGGGNQAHYQPTSTGKKATVHIWTCDNTIGFLYGGGNAADVGTNEGIGSATDVIIDGGRIEWVFGGGNGAGNDNPGANIYGNVGVSYHAGKITNLFGGSNEKGDITGSKTVSVLNDGPCTYNQITELYGGSNLAPLNGNVSLTMLCHANANNCQIGTIFGGSRNANINGNVTLTIEGGLYNYAFGGNNIGGTINGNVTLNLYGGTIREAAFGGNKGGGSITGDITVNVEDHCSCPLEVKDVFGAGDQAMYTAPTSSGAREFNPLVYINNMCNDHTITGNVYGGGNGDPTNNTQEPGMVTGNPKVIIGDLTTGNENYVAAISGNVYGGGNAAKVVGNTTVLMQKANSTVGHDIYGGGNLADVSGSVEVEVTGGTVTQDVYGGGALADVNVTDGALTTGATTTVTLAGGTVRDIYGGGLGRRENTPIAAKVYGPVTVTVNSGTVRDVFGCNNENGAPQSTVQVNINNNVSRNVYGGGNLAAYTGIPDVNINAGTVSGSVFGGGNQAGVGGGDVTMTDGCVLTGIYGGCNTSGNVNGAVNVYVNGGTVGNSTTHADGVYGGGFGAGTSTGSDVTVTIGNADGTTPEIFGDVYGGSAKGNVNSSEASPANTTKVWLKKGTITGDIYGGGYGLDDAEALVYGNVEVLVSGGTVNSYTSSGNTLGGRVFGCNNVKGTPKGMVDVTIDATNPSTGAGDEKVYALQGVYGGGNLAAYDPTTPYEQSMSVVYPKVTVNGCASSIKDVYGGGNAAPVPNSKVIINGGDIKRVFAGGNGESGTPAHIGWNNIDDDPSTESYGTGIASAEIKGGTIEQVFCGSNANGMIRTSSSVDVNKSTATGACPMKIREVYGGGNFASGNAGTINIGCTGTLEPLGSGEHYGINQEGIQYVYGGANQAEITSNITLNINSGIVENVFGGNNQSGSISGIIKVNINKDNTASCAEHWYVGNVYGGGNVAAYSAPSGSLNYPEVNILNGTVSQDVFGGGLGEDARVTGNPVVNINGGTVSGKTFGGGSAAPVTGNPTVNAYKGTAPYVYGGGLGSTAIVTGKPLVLVNQTSGQTLTVTDVFGGGDEAGVTGNTTVQLKAGTVTRAFGGGNVADITGTTTVSLQGATATNIYGGGNEANVSSTASVSVSSGSISGGGGVYGGCNTKGSVGGKITVEVTGGTIGADGNPSSVFGGGYGGYDDNTHPGTSTNGDVEVTINGGTINGDVYGGSAKGSVNNASGDQTKVTLTSGTIHGDLYGGGLGDATHAAAVNGAVHVIVNGGTVANVFGCNNVNGAPQDTVGVAINNGNITNDVYGGGNFAAYDANIVGVTISGGTVNGRVFGGGNNITSDDPNNNIYKGVLGSFVEMTGGEVKGGVYGGCNEKGTVVNNAVVNVIGGTIGDQTLLNGGTTADVYGGGLGENTRVNGNVTVTISRATGTNPPDAPTIYGDVYGGSALGSVNTDEDNTTIVNILDGTLETHRTSETLNGQIIYYYTGGNVYGGGLGRKAVGQVGDPGYVAPIAAEVKGVVTVNIGSGTVVTSGEYAGYTTTPNTGNATIGGNIYGCNNANGSPEQNVTVNVFATAHTPENHYETGTGYAIPNVFGGGNEADYTATGKTAAVNIYGCDNTIERTFGGGNAAAAPHVATFIQGGRFAQVFGGGNGERGIDHGANITAGIDLTIHGGNVGQFFGGSNQNGVVTGSLNTTVDNNGPCGGDLTITEFFCGGNFVNINGDLETTITCSDGMNVTSLYGGCNMAYITGHVVLNLYGGNYTNVYGGSKGDLASLGSGHIDQAANIGQYVTLNLYGGTIENVFGGSNVNGNIGGVITVNVLDVEDPVCPLHITNIYGGSNMTNYTPTGSNVISPVVNVIHAKYGIGGNVYGGSKGVSGTEVDVMANPLVNIGYDASLNGYIPSTGANAYTVPLSPRAIVAGSVFGGGDAAKVQGNTAIFLRNKAKVFGNVYGGGNMGEVTGNTKVIVNGANE